ncbi:MAG: hypothetical protein K5894_00835 [Lachnospiraceae bacterium]|nr:hypothetical protein [Lachnospiraceae bacterium]
MKRLLTKDRMKAAAALSAVTLMMTMNPVNGMTETLDGISRSENSRSENSCDKTDSENSKEESQSENSSDSENKKEENQIFMTVSRDQVRYTKGKIKASIEINDRLNKGNYKIEYKKNNMKIEAGELNERSLGLENEGKGKRYEIEFPENGTYTIKASDKDGIEVSETVEINSIIKRQAAKATDNYSYKPGNLIEKKKISELKFPLQEIQENAGVIYIDEKAAITDRSESAGEEKFLRKMEAQAEADEERGFFTSLKKKILSGFGALIDDDAARYIEKIMGQVDDNEDEDAVYDILSKKLISPKAAKGRMRTAAAVGASVFMTGLCALYFIQRRTK